MVVNVIVWRQEVEQVFLVEVVNDAIVGVGWGGSVNTGLRRMLLKVQLGQLSPVNGVVEVVGHFLLLNNFLKQIK